MSIVEYYTDADAASAMRWGVV